MNLFSTLIGSNSSVTQHRRECRQRNSRRALYGLRVYCTSDSEDSSSSSLTQELNDNIDELKAVSSSLKEGGLVQEKHITELKRVCRHLAYNDLPGLKWVIEDAAQARCRGNGGVDPAGQRVQDVLGKIAYTQDTVRLLADEHEPPSLSKGPRKRNAPGEGEARAAELSGLLEHRVIPAVSETLTAYRELVAAGVDDSSADADSAAAGPDFEGGD